MNMNTNITIKRAALAAALLGLALGASSCNTTAGGVASSMLNQMSKPAAAQAADTARVLVTGTVLDPNGKAPGKQMQVHACLSGLDVMRHPGMHKTMLYKCRELGNDMGVVNKEGALQFQGQPGRSYALIIWAPDFEPLIIRNVTAPGDIGTVKIKGYNKTLEQVNHTTRDDLSPL